MLSGSGLQPEEEAVEMDGLVPALQTCQVMNVAVGVRLCSQGGGNREGDMGPEPEG